MQRDISIQVNPQRANPQNAENDDTDSLIDSLEENINKVVIVFTQSGGCSGQGFTGLLVEVNNRFIRLVTSIPSAPRHPFGRSVDFDDFEFNHRRCNRSRFGTSIVIPIRKIVSFVTNTL